MLKKICILLAAFCLLMPGIGAQEKYSGTVKILDCTGGDRTALYAVLQLHEEYPALEFEIRRKSTPDFVPDLTLYEGVPKPGDRLYSARYIYVTVNAANLLKDLTLDQLRGICSGKLAEWTTLTGSPFSIHRYALALRAGPNVVKMILGKEQHASFYRAGNADELYLLLGGNLHALGLCTESPGDAKNVKVISVEGKMPGSGDYPLLLPRSLSLHHPGPAQQLFSERLIRLSASSPHAPVPAPKNIK